jgi:hypothetical protein
VPAVWPPDDATAARLSEAVAKICAEDPSHFERASRARDMRGAARSLWSLWVGSALLLGGPPTFAGIGFVLSRGCPPEDERVGLLPAAPATTGHAADVEPLDTVPVRGETSLPSGMLLSPDGTALLKWEDWGPDVTKGDLWCFNQNVADVGLPFFVPARPVTFRGPHSFCAVGRSACEAKWLEAGGGTHGMSSCYRTANQLGPVADAQAQCSVCRANRLGNPAYPIIFDCRCSATAGPAGAAWVAVRPRVPWAQVGGEASVVPYGWARGWVVDQAGSREFAVSGVSSRWPIAFTFWILGSDGDATDDTSINYIGPDPLPETAEEWDPDRHEVFIDNGVTVDLMMDGPDGERVYDYDLTTGEGRRVRFQAADPQGEPVMLPEIVEQSNPPIPETK